MKYSYLQGFPKVFTSVIEKDNRIFYCLLFAHFQVNKVGLGKVFQKLMVHQFYCFLLKNSMTEILFSSLMVIIAPKNHRPKTNIKVNTIFVLKLIIVWILYVP